MQQLQQQAAGGATAAAAAAGAAAAAAAVTAAEEGDVFTSRDGSHRNGPLLWQNGAGGWYVWLMGWPTNLKGKKT